LVRVYSFAVDDYNEAVMVLREHSGRMSKREYQTIHAVIERTRTLVERARAGLNKHTAKHGC
jgi:hypothetical protein